jgi:hypothetical protein
LNSLKDKGIDKTEGGGEVKVKISRKVKVRISRGDKGKDIKEEGIRIKISRRG